MDSGGRLFEKVEDEDLAGVIEVLQGKTNLNFLKKGDSALHMAARKSRLDFLRLLVEHGDDVNKQNQMGNTAMHYAARNGNEEMVEYLIKHGASVNTQNSEGDSPIQGVVKSQTMDMIEKMIGYGMNVNIQNEQGETPLHTAALHGRQEAIEALLLHGADSSIPNKHNKKASEASKYPDIGQAMLRYNLMLAAVKSGKIKAKGMTLSSKNTAKPLTVERVDVVIENMEFPDRHPVGFYCRREFSENSSVQLPLELADEMFSDVFHIRVSDVTHECRMTISLPMYAARPERDDVVVKFLDGEMAVPSTFYVKNEINFCTIEATFLPETTRFLAVFTRPKREDTVVGEKGMMVTSEQQEDFQLDIPAGTFQEDTKITLRVFSTAVNELEPGEEGQCVTPARCHNEPVLLTDVYQINIDGEQPSKTVTLQFPLIESDVSDNDIVLLRADENKLVDENSLEELDVAPNIVASTRVTFEVSHFCIHVASTRSKLVSDKPTIYQHVVNSARRNRPAAFLIVLRKEETSNSFLAIVECSLAGKVRNRIKKWKDKGYMIQKPETSGSFMLAPYEEFVIGFRGMFDLEREPGQRKIAFLPTRPSYQPYRMTSKVEEGIITGEVVLTKIDPEGKMPAEVKTCLPFQVQLRKPKPTLSVQNQTPKPQKPFIMPAYLSQK